MKETTRVRNTAQITVISAALLMLAACGGGSSNDSTGDGAGSSSAINSGNSTVVASRAYAVASVLYSTGENATQLVDVKSASTTSRDAQFNLAEFALHKVLDFDAADRSSAKLAGKAVQTHADACSLAGSFTETWNDADNNDILSSGDTASITFTNCVDEPGIRLNGTISLSNLSITGSAATPSRSVGATFLFESLQLSVDDASATVHGDMALQAALTNFAPFTYDISINGKNLAVTEGSWQEALTAYKANVFIDFTSGRYAYGVAGTVSGTGFPTAITMATPRTLTGNIGAYPTTGVTIASAADGTAARLTVNSATNVTIDLDADADGTFESSETMTWAQLTAL
ncbi:MAG: hypothetical protein WCZ28_05875 [Burkholderiaceae bacterium]